MRAVLLQVRAATACCREERIVKHVARLIPAMLVAALAASMPQHDPKHPARQWWDNHVDQATLKEESQATKNISNKQKRED